jgi:hypothetical protein
MQPDWPYPSHTELFRIDLAEDDENPFGHILLEVLFEFDGHKLGWSLERYCLDGEWHRHRTVTSDRLDSYIWRLADQLITPKLQEILMDHPEYAS